MKKEQALSLIRRLMAAFPRSEFGKDTVDVYLEELIAHEFAPAQIAIRVGCARRWKFFPALSELVTAIDDERSEHLAPELAWSEVIAALRAGPNRKPWTSPAIERAVRAVGGMAYLNSAPLAANPTSDRARFVDAYRVALTQHEQADYREQLTGEVTPDARAIVGAVIKGITQ